MENPVLPSSCVTPAGTSIEVQNEWEENTHTHTHSTVQYSTWATRVLVSVLVLLQFGGQKMYVVCEESMRRSYARVPYVGSIFRSTPQLSVTLGLVPWPV